MSRWNRRRRGPPPLETADRALLDSALHRIVWPGRWRRWEDGYGQAIGLLQDRAREDRRFRNTAEAELRRVLAHFTSADDARWLAAGLPATTRGR